ncbi:hypothetical protein Rsub_05061 [Raphidocelis subcapitata]|uniref:Uncharacterized protein n=1 Tax=Raphidocelis subcapitata TaxID=307507 RepID=A0A2V0P192_9CHLO|nr:hypothetical protein Rsub_05061 [Raphidocelis subcapitata]|eukprot:GBF92692.1 hypothetical protein Rsub_05061 [Raphidocelis subcapitata]
MAGIEAWNTSELLAACCGSTVKIWSPAAAEPRREVKLSEGADVHALDWSGNNKVLAIAGDKPQITMVGGGKVIGSVPEGVEPGLAGIAAIKFSGDSKKLVVGCANRTLHIRDLRTQGAGNKYITDHKGAVCALAISPDDGIIASASSVGQVLLHDLKAGVKLGSLPGDGPIRGALHFCPLDGDQLAAASDDGSVCVWSVRARTPRQELRRLHRGGATGVRFAPDNPSLLYSCGADMRLVVIDTRQPSGPQQEALTLHAPQALTCMDVRFDARTIAAGTAGGGVLVFDLRRPGPASGVYSFGEQGPVRCVRWQNAPHSSSKHRAGQATSVSAAPTVSAGGQLGGRPALNGAAAPAAALGGRGGMIGAGRAAGAADATMPPLSPRSVAVTPDLPRGVSPEPSHASDFGLEGLRAVSPVRLADSAAATPSAATPALPSAAAPADSFASGMAAFMVTPGVGVTLGLGAAGAGLADATPVSRLAPAGAGAGANGGAGAGALPPTAAGGRAAATGAGARAGAQEPAAAAAAAPTRGAAGAGRQAAGAGAPRTPRGAGFAGAARAAPAQAAPPAPAPAANGRAGPAPGSRAASNAASAAVDAAAAAAIDALGGAAAAAAAAAARPAAAAAAAAAAGPPAAGPGALREDVFKAFLEQQMSCVRQDVRNLHLEVLQQFHQAQMDLMSVVEGLAQRQEAILTRLDALAEQVADLSDAQGGPQAGIAMAWL